MDTTPMTRTAAHFWLLHWQVSARKLKPPAQAPPTLHERILEEIKAERKLRPVSPSEVRRGRLGKKRCCFSVPLVTLSVLTFDLNIQLWFQSFYVESHTRQCCLQFFALFIYLFFLPNVFLFGSNFFPFYSPFFFLLRCKTWTSC